MVNKTQLFLGALLLISSAAFAQPEGVSPAYSFSIKKKIEPPYLEFVPGSVQFIDADGNNAINANEACTLEFELKNSGTGDGLNLKAALNASGTSQGLRYQTLQTLVNLPKNSTNKYRLEIAGAMDTQDGKVVLKLEIQEPNGFNTDAVEMEIATKKFAAPNILVPDYTIFSADGSTNLALRKPFSLQLLVQNTGQGIAKDVQYRFEHPINAFVLGGEESGSFSDLKPGETKSLEFQIVLNAKFEGTTLNLGLDLSENLGKYSKDWKGTFNLNQALASEKLVVQAKAEEQFVITEATLRSDVDKDIPLGITPNAIRYALIIGNEDYTKYQPGLEKEVNVAYANNDARVFAEYAEKTLGVPKKNITLLIDATKGQMSQQLAQLRRMTEVERGEAEVIFYFSGHGLPEEATNTPYLIPVDVSGMQPSNGLALQDVYNALSAFPSKKVTIILDACFSGGARQKELVAMKGVKVKANVENVPANLVVLASSSGTEASAVYTEKQHGYFTYFLLKDLKETKGKAILKETVSRVQQNVSREATRIGKLQTPTFLLGPATLDKWEVLTW